jgi:hypothetical protein
MGVQDGCEQIVAGVNSTPFELLDEELLHLENTALCREVRLGRQLGAYGRDVVVGPALEVMLSLFGNVERFRDDGNGQRHSEGFEKLDCSCVNPLIDEAIGRGFDGRSQSVHHPRRERAGHQPAIARVAGRIVVEQRRRQWQGIEHQLVVLGPDLIRRWLAVAPVPRRERFDVAQRLQSTFVGDNQVEVVGLDLLDETIGAHGGVVRVRLLLELSVEEIKSRHDVYLSRPRPL